MTRACIIALALSATAIQPSAAETLIIWGKSATVIAGPMLSGRPGFEAIRVRFAGGGEAFVLRRAPIKAASR